MDDRTLTYSKSNEIDKTPSFGQLNEYSVAVPTSVTVIVAGEWYPWLSAQDSSHRLHSGESTCMTYVGDITKIIIGIDGQGRYDIGFSSSLSGQMYVKAQVAILLNGEKMNGSEQIGTLFQNDAILPFSNSGCAELVAGDEISIGFTSDSDSDILKIYTANLHIKRCGKVDA